MLRDVLQGHLEKKYIYLKYRYLHIIYKYLNGTYIAIYTCTILNENNLLENLICYNCRLIMQLMNYIPYV